MAALKKIRDPLFLPNFCAPRTLLTAVLLSEALAAVLILISLGSASVAEYWHKLLLYSIFIHFVTLSSLSLLCLGRAWLGGFSNGVAALLCYLLILAITLAVTEVVWWFNLTSVIPSPNAAKLVNVEEAYLVSPLGVSIELQSGTLDLHLEQHIAMLSRNLGISAIVGAVALRYFYVQHQWRLKTESEAEARVQALQSRMNPHFLFNSMNTIASLTRISPELAEQAVEDLAELFRASLADARHLVPLEQEVRLCEHYLRIESLRLGERLQVQWMLDTVPQDALVPSLCLQPLLENGIRYGIQPLPEGGIITVSGLTDRQHIKIDIESPLHEAQTVRKGNRISQDNLRQRLQVYYGRKGRMDIAAGDGVYRVSLRFPYQT